MSNAVYAAVVRQAGLMQEMQLVANNLANASTTGFKADRAIFAEFLMGAGSADAPVSMGGLAGHAYDLEQGGLRFTGGKFDLAIQGDGYFAVETPQGARLTRAGHFQLSSDGQLIDGFGNKVLGLGGGPIQIPEEASTVAIAGDGSISVDGELLDAVGVFDADGDMQREGNALFHSPDGYTPTGNPNVIQGALEQSNVAPVLEIARMIEVQRAYEAGQSLLEKEDDRISRAINTLRQL